MDVQLWSSHYRPQASGIGPLAGAIAEAMAATGTNVSVITADPFYPSPRWGTRWLPYRETRNGIPILRLPIGKWRGSALGRIAQELSYTAALIIALPWMKRPDLILAISPSFLALAPAMIQARRWRLPWVLWLQDILPDAAVDTGMVNEGPMLRVARRFEAAAYRSADHIVVISESFKENLTAKGVEEAKITNIFNPSTQPLARPLPERPPGDGKTILTMGNVGYTQNLAEVVKCFEGYRDLEKRNVHFVIAGDGAAADEVRAAISTERVKVTGYLDEPELEQELAMASVALISQKYASASLDFNVPSKLMNFMARGLPIVAAVRPQSEVARIVNASNAGWVIGEDLNDLGTTLVEALDQPAERLVRGRSGQRFAQQHFAPKQLASQMVAVLDQVHRKRVQRTG